VLLDVQLARQHRPAREVTATENSNDSTKKSKILRVGTRELRALRRDQPAHLPVIGRSDSQECRFPLHGLVRSRSKIYIHSAVPLANREDQAIRAIPEESEASRVIVAASRKLALTYFCPAWR